MNAEAAPAGRTDAVIPERLAGIHRAKATWIVSQVLHRLWKVLVFLALAMVPDVSWEALRDPWALGVALGLVLGIAALVALVLSVVSYVSWRSRTWELDEEGITVSFGVFVKRQVQIAYEHIHAVNVSERLLDRAFGMVALDIDTGAAETDNSLTRLQGVARDLASELEAYLFVRTHEEGQELAGESRPAAASASEAAQGSVASAPAQSCGPTDAPTTATVREAVFCLRGKRLLLAAASHTQLMATTITIVVFGIQALTFLDELHILSAQGAITAGIERIPATAWFVVGFAIVVAVLLVGLLVSFVVNLLTLSQYSSHLQGDTFVVKSGLFNRRSRRVVLERVQSIHIEQGAIRQLIGYAVVRASVVASYAGENNEAEGSEVLLHPFIRRDEVEEFLDKVVPGCANLPSRRCMEHVPKVALRRTLVRRTVVAVLLCALVVAARNLLFVVAPFMEDDLLVQGLSWGVVSAACTMLTAYLVIDGVLDWRHRRSWRDCSRAAFVTGGFSRSMVVMPRRCMQHLGVRQSPLQRWAHVATLCTESASVGDAVRLVDMDEREALAFHEWLRGSRR